MRAGIIDGKAIAFQIKEELKENIRALGREPKLVIIWVGDNPATAAYIRQKERVAAELGINFEVIRYDSDVSLAQIKRKIIELNSDKSVDGFIIQTPLPSQLPEEEIFAIINSAKDVDGVNPASYFKGATPLGIIELLKRSGRQIAGKHAVVIGRSNLVGKPTAALLLQNNATVTICHSKTPNLAQFSKTADILVVAIGKPRFITEEMVKKGAIVIDVGINKVSGKLVGDVDFENVQKVASFLTPVPGGVGPMTVAMLFSNLVQACLKKDLTSK